MMAVVYNALFFSDIGLVLVTAISFLLNIRATIILKEPLMRLRFGATAALSLIYAIGYMLFAFNDDVNVISNTLRTLGWITWFVVWWAPSLIAVRVERRRLGAALKKQDEVLP